MSHILCVLTVLAVDWNRLEYQSTLMSVPCVGRDQIMRMELVVAPTLAEYHELQRVLDKTMTSQKEAFEVQSFAPISSFVGPHNLGRHYGPMLRENQEELSQNRTVRLVSITERVQSGQLSCEDHLYGRLSESYSTERPSESHEENDPLVNASEPENELSHQKNVQDRLRVRRAADLINNIDARFDVDTKTNNEKHGSDNLDSKHLTTGGGYGSQTCTNAVFTAWNNSTFDSGKCGCDCPACPSCKTESFLAMTERANIERQSIQTKLFECQEKMLGQRQLHSRTNSDSQVSRCSTSEVKRLKEETRSLRARIRRMASSRVSSDVSPTKSTWISSVETVGSALVEGAVQYAANRSQTRNNARVTGVSGVASTATVARKVRPTKKVTSSVKPRRTRPSKIPVSSKTRTQVKPPRKMYRGRRDVDKVKEFESKMMSRMGSKHPWSVTGEDLVEAPFHSSTSKSKLVTGNKISIVIPRVNEIRSSRHTLYNPTHPYGVDRDMYGRGRVRKQRRGRRDAYDSSFIGSSNQAEITAFENANFKGSTENRYDNSTNVRSFRPVVSPNFHVNSRGMNETLITESHNGNDIRITHSPPCTCEDDFGLIMTAVWTQMVLTVVLTLSLALHYHINRRVSHQKKKDLDVVRMQAHTVYRQNRTSQFIAECDGKIMANANCQIKQSLPKSENY